MLTVQTRTHARKFGGERDYDENFRSCERNTKYNIWIYEIVNMLTNNNNNKIIL